MGSDGASWYGAGNHAESGGCYSPGDTGFESPELAFKWLQSPVPVLDGEKPFELLGTDEGCSSVASVIQKIAWGDFS